jgi:glycosyltransferase involved in cell wall biosynthesis
MSETTPTYSIVTTCKGRLADLKRTLPRFARQPDTEVIVTDYDCPDGAAAWIAENHPDVIIVKVEDRPLFNLPEARNMAVEQAKGKVLVFLDADVLVTEGFISTLDLAVGEPVFGIFPTTHGNSLRGSGVIQREHFEAVGGYDELLSGYEGEDLDLYMRLRVLGLKRHFLPDTGVEEVFEQTTEERTRFRRPDLQLQFLRGQLYQLTKEMVLRSQGINKINLDYRKAIMAQVDQQIPGLISGKQDFALTVDFPDKYKRGLLQAFEFSTSISVKAKRKPRV